jgi:AraC family transcriptional regulator
MIIFSKWLPQSNYEHVGKFDFELYDYRFMMDSDESEFDIYISVKPKE